MSPNPATHAAATLSRPRVSGDEPGMLNLAQPGEESTPRERG